MLLNCLLFHMRKCISWRRRYGVKRQAGSDGSAANRIPMNHVETECTQGRVGLIQVYTGSGKGKTTAALGLALRASGYGLHSYIGQFLKGTSYGELKGVQRLAPYVTIEQYGLAERIRIGEVDEKHRVAAREGLAKAQQALANPCYDIVILDEINIALSYGFLSETEVLELMDRKPPQMELVLTGRGAPVSIIDRADLVSEIQEIRHPFSRGIQARLGIEF